MKRALLSMLAALLAAPTLAQARVRPHSAGGYSVQIENASGQVLPTYFHHGQTFVLGDSAGVRAVIDSMTTPQRGAGATDADLVRLAEWLEAP